MLGHGAVLGPLFDLLAPLLALVLFRDTDASAASAPARAARTPRAARYRWRRPPTDSERVFVRSDDRRRVYTPSEAGATTTAPVPNSS